MYPEDLRVWKPFSKIAKMEKFGNWEMIETVNCHSANRNYVINKAFFPWKKFLGNIEGEVELNHVTSSTCRLSKGASEIS